MRISLAANCSAGQYRVDGTNTCAPCVTGEYQPENWKSECIECPTDFTTSEVGAVTEDDCNGESTLCGGVQICYNLLPERTMIYLCIDFCY